MNKRIFNICLFSMVLFSSCRKTETGNNIQNEYYAYFPLRTGDVYIYHIDSAVYNPFDGHYDLSSGYIKEVIDSPFRDNTGNITYKILRYWASDTSKGWATTRAWAAKRTSTTAETWEENTRYIRMAFPIILNRAWNGNQCNNIDSQQQYNYHYVEAHKPFIMPLTGKNYDSTTLVEESNWTDGFLERIIKRERYAINIGLIYREEMDTTWRGPGLGTQQFSYFYKQVLLRHYSVAR